MLCGERKEHTFGQILVFGENSSFLLLTEIGGRCHLPSEICASPPFEKRRLRPISAYNVSTVRASEKCSIIANRKSIRAFKRAIDEVRTLALTPPNGGSKSEFTVFENKIQVQSNKVCYKVFCVKTSSGKVVAESFPWVYRYWR